MFSQAELIVQRIESGQGYRSTKSFVLAKIRVNGVDYDILNNEAFLAALEYILKNKLHLDQTFGIVINDDSKHVDVDRSKMQLLLSQNVCYALSGETKHLELNQACTYYGSKISHNIIRVAASRIFVDPTNALFELISNAVDSYGQIKIGRFGMGFFSILGMLQSADDKIHIKSQGYNYTIKMDGDEYVVDTSKVPIERGTSVGLNGRILDIDQMAKFLRIGFELYNKFAYMSRDYALTFDNGLDIRLINYMNPQEQSVETAYRVDVRSVVNVDEFTFEVKDYSPNGISPDDVYNLMLVPSRSSKKLDRGTLIPLEQHPATLGDERLDMGYFNYYITCGGVTIAHDTVYSESLNRELKYHLAFPINMPLVVSRDDFLVNDLESRQIYLDTIRDLIFKTHAVRPDIVGYLIVGLEKYSSTTVNESLIRFAIAKSVDVILNQFPTLILPISNIATILGNYIAESGGRYITLNDRNYEDSRLRFLNDLHTVRRYVGMKALKLPGLTEPSNGGFIDLLFIPQSYDGNQLKKYETQQSVRSPLIMDSTILAETALNQIEHILGMISLIYGRSLPTSTATNVNIGQLLYRYAAQQAYCQIYQTKILNAVIEYSTNSYKGQLVNDLLHESGVSGILNMLIFCVIDFLTIPNEQQRMDVISRYIGHIIAPSLNSLSSNQQSVYLMPAAIDVSILPYITPNDTIEYVPDYNDCMELLTIPPTTFYTNTIIFPIYNTRSAKKPPIRSDSNTKVSSMLASRHFLETLIVKRTKNSSLLLDKSYSYKMAVVYSSCILIIHQKVNHVPLDKIRKEFIVRYSEQLCRMCYDTSFHPIYVDTITESNGTYFEQRILNPMLNFAQILVSISTSPPRPISQESGKIEGEFYVTQLINLLARKEIDTRVGRLGSTYLLEAANAPKGMELQSLQIVLRSGTDKEYFDAALTELLQNSIDAIRRVSGEGESGHYIEVDTDGYSYSVADTVGIDPAHIPSLLIPFLSSKDGDASTGEMGTGFYTILREDMVRHVDIITLHSGRSLRLRLKVEGNDIHVSWKIDPYSNVNDEKGTRIVVSMNVDGDVDAYIARINEYARSFLPGIDAPCKFNGRDVKRSLVVAIDRESHRVLKRNDNVQFPSLLFTHGVPFGYLDKYIEDLNTTATVNANLRTLLSKNVILDIKKSGYRPVQSRNRLILSDPKSRKEILLSIATVAMSYLTTRERCSLLGKGFQIMQYSKDKSAYNLSLSEYRLNGGSYSENGVGYIFYDTVISYLDEIERIAILDYTNPRRNIKTRHKFEVRGYKTNIAIILDEYINDTYPPEMKIFSGMHMISQDLSRAIAAGDAKVTAREKRSTSDKKTPLCFPEEAMRFYQHAVDVYWNRILAYKLKDPDNPLFNSFAYDRTPILLVNYDDNNATALAYYKHIEHSITFNSYLIDVYPIWDDVKSILLSCKDQPSNLPMAINVGANAATITLLGMYGLDSGTLWHELLHAVLSIEGEGESSHRPIAFDGKFKTFDEMIRLAISYVLDSGDFFDALLDFEFST